MMLRRFKNFYHKFQALLANIYYLFPSRKLKIIGVTGTDGKTTTVAMIYHVLKVAKVKVGMISTIEVLIGNKSYDSGFHVTTPEPWQLPKYLHLMRKEGVKFVIIEATSNGLEQNRLFGIKFDSSAITNIKEDHLDYHHTWENYAEAKFRLLQQTKDHGLAVMNLDDSKAAKWLQRESRILPQTLYAKWVTKKSLQNKQLTREGIKFDYKGVNFRVPILGDYNFENVLQVIGVCERYLDLENIREALLSFNSPEGRMQLMQVEPFVVIVDFAHTPEALRKALQSVEKLKRAKKNRIITVFGCAGQRDKGRRRMGEISAQYSDITILTAEDPRDEELGDINNEIFSYAEKKNGVLVERFTNHDAYGIRDLKDIKAKVALVVKNQDKPFLAFDENSIRSREDAIELALRLANSDDIVFITGKGHEKSMAFGKQLKEYAWSDQKVVNRKLKKVLKS